MADLIVKSNVKEELAGNAVSADFYDALTVHYYELNVVEDIEPFTVVKRRNSDHPELLFRNTVDRWSQGDYHVFVLKDQLAVEQAVTHGAKRLSETDLES